jgi:hypothetical protein
VLLVVAKLQTVQQIRLVQMVVVLTLVSSQGHLVENQQFASWTTKDK